jgi:preprotein translocase subunit YajC
MRIEIDKENPISMAYNSIIISFVIFVGLFYLFTPSWVQVVNQITGKLSLSWSLILCYSITFSFVFAIFVFMVILNQRKHSENIGYEIDLKPSVFIEK